MQHTTLRGTTGTDGSVASAAVRRQEARLLSLPMRTNHTSHEATVVRTLLVSNYVSIKRYVGKGLKTGLCITLFYGVCTRVYGVYTLRLRVPQKWCAVAVTGSAGKISGYFAKVLVFVRVFSGSWLLA